MRSQTNGGSRRTEEIKTGDDEWTCISLKSNTRKVLRVLKAERGASSYDEVLRDEIDVDIDKI